MSKKINIFLLGLLIVSVAVSAKMRDPTQPAGAPNYYQAENPNSAYGIKIDSIIIGKHRKVVIIKGHHLTVGDKIMDLKIVDILRHSVRFKDENEEFTVLMPYISVKSSKSSLTKKGKTL